jgi:uncharacterized protein
MTSDKHTKQLVPPRVTLLLGITVMLHTAALSSQEPDHRRPPIIDMHLHAFGKLQTAPKVEMLPGILAADNVEELQSATLARLEQHNIVKAVTSGPLSEQYRRAAPERILASPLLFDASEPVESIRAAFAAGRYQALAEFAPQYRGLTPDDPSLEPYFALAEELDVPVGIHMGLGPSGAAYAGSPKYRMAHSNPLLLEDVLIRHPKLRLYVMHAGWPMLDEMMGLLQAHPQVYVDIAVINWVLPEVEFYRYLQRLVDAGFVDRIMFGSDQMDWPDAITRAIETVEAAPFLTAEQSRDIMCRNAMRFLRLQKTVCE